MIKKTEPLEGRKENSKIIVMGNPFMYENIVSGQTCLDLEGAQCMGKIEVTLRKQNHLINLPWFDVVPKNEHMVITLLTQQACCSF